MARTNATNYTGVNQFPYATAGTDIFKKEDLQTLALAVDNHDHTTGKGLPITGAIPPGSITSTMIADGTIQATDIASGTITGTQIANGAITTTQIADGTIATADLANNAVTNAKLGTDTARLNLLTNGGFEIWQRGNGPFTTAVPTTDRWFLQLVGTDTFSVSRNTANVDVGSGACAAVTFTLGTGAGASSLYQTVNDQVPSLIGRNLSFSVRVNTATANAVRIALQDQSGASLATSAFHPGGGTYQTLTVTTASVLPGSLTALYIKVLFAATCTAYIDNAMLVVGSVAADYAPLHPADDLARCNRYYQRWNSGGAGDVLTVGHVYTTTGSIGSWGMRATMSATPTFTCRAVGDFCIVNATNFQGPQCTGIGIYLGNVDHIGISANVASGLVANSAGAVVSTVAAGSSAWAALEANP